MEKQAGIVVAIDGPVVRMRGAALVGMLELVGVGEERLPGEVIRVQGDEASIQVYEPTSGLRPGLPVYATGRPLSAALGPGLVGGIFDGMGRPLTVLREAAGAFIKRGVHAPSLDPRRKWPFRPVARRDQELSGGAVLGTVQETPLIEHRVLVPPDAGGVVRQIVSEGEYTVEEVIAVTSRDGQEQQLRLAQNWPVRRPRPYRNRSRPSVLLVSGQRILDMLFPLAKGGTAVIPGGFGTGKTVLQHQLARWADAQIIVYVGCGERGNEMTEVLVEFPELLDPHTGRPLLERTILIANTSNMPVAAREASIYTGMTVAEYFRDMGYHVALMADSTSRWAEALREIAGRLEEMPAEEGFPAYLPSRLAEFYERAGFVEPLSGGTASVTAVGAVSPPGGDFSEPVTQNSLRFTRCFWALDKGLASARHFPAISWLESYSGYVDSVVGWWRERGYPEWSELRDWTLSLLQDEDRLQQIVKLVGPDALPDEERLILVTARILKEGFLQQSAIDPVDTFCPIEKQYAMLALIEHLHTRAKQLIALGCPVLRIRGLGVIDNLMRMKTEVPNDELQRLEIVRASLDSQMDELSKDYQRGLGVRS
ncbi:MAG: V-type ATP synthase subunit A [Chloroflexota bacterium]|nr:MAG: V-type ATP synthase subunit A [Chloroflexota bacterium]